MHTGNTSAASVTGHCWCRRILYRPADMQWRLLSYKSSDEPLAITDLQRMEHASLPSVIPITPGAEPSCAMQQPCCNCRQTNCDKALASHVSISHVRAVWDPLAAGKFVSLRQGWKQLCGYVEATQGMPSPFFAKSLLRPASSRVQTLNWRKGRSWLCSWHSSCLEPAMPPCW